MSSLNSLVAAYRQRVRLGELESDRDQEIAVERLELLTEDLARWSRGGWPRKPKPPRGLYLWGPVGRGKSMLLDLFFVLLGLR